MLPLAWRLPVEYSIIKPKPVDCGHTRNGASQNSTGGCHPYVQGSANLQEIPVKI